MPGLYMGSDVPDPDEPFDFEQEFAALTAGVGPTSPSDPVQAHSAAVDIEVQRLRVQAEAKAVVTRERTPVAPPFDAGLLSEILARAPEPPHRVEGLIPAEASTTIVGQRKCGKTHFAVNLSCSLITGHDFLKRFAVRPIAGNVAWLNYEVSGATAAKWAHEVGVPTDRMLLVNLRGRRNPLNDPDDMARLAALLRAHDTESLIVDPFGRAFTGTAQNDSGEVGAYLAQLDQFTRTAVGAKDLILTAHAGWDGERTRGASALEDWPDSIVTITRGTGDDSDNRYVRAIGRDVDLEEDRLNFDPRTRLLSLSGGGSRREANTSRKAQELQAAVVAVVTMTPGINGTDVEVALRRDGIGMQKDAHRKALASAVGAGLIRLEPGKRNQKLYFPTEPPRDPPTSPGGVSENPPEPPLCTGGFSTGSSTANPPGALCGEDYCSSIAEKGSAYCWKHGGVAAIAVRPCGHQGAPTGRCGVCIAEGLNAAAEGGAA